MTKDEMEAFLEQQIRGLADYVSGFKACAKVVIDNWDKKGTDGTGTEVNAGTSEVS